MVSLIFYSSSWTTLSSSAVIITVEQDHKINCPVIDLITNRTALCPVVVLLILIAIIVVHILLHLLLRTSSLTNHIAKHHPLTRQLWRRFFLLLHVHSSPAHIIHVPFNISSFSLLPLRDIRIDSKYSIFSVPCIYPHFSTAISSTTNLLPLSDRKDYPSFSTLHRETIFWIVCNFLYPNIDLQLPHFWEEISISLGISPCTST